MSATLKVPNFVLFTFLFCCEPHDPVCAEDCLTTLRLSNQ